MRLIENFFDVIAPPICQLCGQEGTSLCADCTSVNLPPFGERCYRCNRLSLASRTCPKCARLGGPRHLWIRATYSGLAERLIDAYKFHSERPVARVLAYEMAAILPLKRREYWLVPIPTAATRRRERGFDHTDYLAIELASLLGIEKTNLLVHVGSSRQVGATRAERLRQAQQSYRLKSNQSLKGRNILLVDDVLTTGATMQVATKLLRQAGAARVDGLVFAKRL